MSHVPPDPRPQTHSSAFTSVASGLGPPKGARAKEGGGRGGRREERRTRPGAPAQRVGQAAAGRPSGQSALRPQLTTKKGTTTCSTVGPPPKWARRAICAADGVAPASTINHQSTRRTMATCSRQPPGQLGCVGRPPTCRLPRPRISQLSTLNAQSTAWRNTPSPHSGSSQNTSPSEPRHPRAPSPPRGRTGERAPPHCAPHGRRLDSHPWPCASTGGSSTGRRKHQMRPPRTLSVSSGMLAHVFAWHLNGVWRSGWLYRAASTRPPLAPNDPTAGSRRADGLNNNHTEHERCQGERLANRPPCWARGKDLTSPRGHHKKARTLRGSPSRSDD